MTSSTIPGIRVSERPKLYWQLTFGQGQTLVQKWFCVCSSYPAEFWVSKVVTVWNECLIFLPYRLECSGCPPPCPRGQHLSFGRNCLSELPREENRNDDLLSEQLNWDLSEYFPIKKWLKIHGTHALITGQDIGNQDCPRSQNSSWKSKTHGPDSNNPSWFQNSTMVIAKYL